MEEKRGIRYVIGFSRMEKKYEWKDHVIFMGLLLGFAFWVNRGIELKGLYMDDLYLWSCYGEQSFLQYIFPVGSTRFRFLYYLAAWLEMMLVGDHVSWFVPINILLNVAVAWTVYFMGHSLSRSKAVGFGAGLMYLASRFAYYQIGQVLGMMETLALWLSLLILWCLYRCLNEKGGEKRICTASVLYFCLCFVHERYMALFPLLLLVLLAKKCRRPLPWCFALLSFALVQGIRAAAIGSLLPAGSGHTNVADTFTLSSALGFALDQLAYLFGAGAGPIHLSGLPWQETPLWVKLLVVLADLTLAAVTAAFLARTVLEKEKEHKVRRLQTFFLFVLFIGACIASSSVTIRVEMRWIYASLAAALLLLSYMYGELTCEVQPEFYLKRLWPWGALLLAYVVLMLPTELYSRAWGWPNIYFFPEQARYNSLAEVTREKYGDLEGKTVYIIGNSYEVSDFTARTFYKVYQKERTAQLTEVKFIDSVWEIGLVSDDMLVLKEDPDNNDYADVTDFVRDMKLHVEYGYYRDNWMDEEGRVTVMAGADGLINLEFIFPGVLEGGELATVTREDGQELRVPLRANVTTAQIQAEPWERVPLTFHYNFHMQGVDDQRSGYRLATLVRFSVE